MDKADRMDIPPDLAEALAAAPAARKRFEGAGESYRSGLLALVRETRDRDHRASRIELVVRTLQQ